MLSLVYFLIAGYVYAQDAASLETKVLPVLRANCFACHNDKNSTSGLSLESRESLLRGGNRGPVVSTSGSNLLVDALRQTGTLKMPPGRKLPDAQIELLEQWVKAGTPMPASMLKSRRPGADHWAFQPVRRPKVPTATKNPIDAFILDRLAKVKLSLSAEAPRATLLRRVSLDLTGLPPSPKELADFLNDPRPDAYERAVDALLALPHYGERWARVWLDIARYADSDGYTIDAPRDIWHYRDWVINALNNDMPFDRFVIEQMAGDMLPNATRDQLIATGFHRNTPSNFEGGIDFEQYRVEAVADRVQTTGAAFLGLTLGCARCHDHKYDPVTQREFYQIFAFLNNVDEVDREADRRDFNKPFLPVGKPDEMKAYGAWEAQMQALEREMNAYKSSIPGTGQIGDPGVVERQRGIDAHRRRMPKITRTLIMRELPAPRQAYVHLDGDFTRRGANVEAGVPSFLPPLNKKEGRATRLDFAQWLVARNNPLTARVTVNRAWQKFFGKGLVDTENDFGTMGEKPTHPELLDYLAAEFMENGWSQKAMHKQIVMSATYRQDSRLRADAKAVDPENRLLARQTRLRLEAELVRDSALIASGLFAAKLGGPSVYPPLPAGASNVTQVKREWKTSSGPDRYRRGLYTYFQRSAPHPGLILFDAPDGTVTCTRRIRSNSPLQALTLLNDEAYFEFAQALSKRILTAKESSDEARIKEGYLLALNRPPAETEAARLRKLIAAQRDSGRDDQAIWIAVSRVLLNLDEFMTRE
ncbi:MAG: PSD1 domain-containing protein [Candidatus Solibacter usitatus]|nr:PSD1 domain-containing protein [Candidatus Solibacter usitatus]